MSKINEDIFTAIDLIVGKRLEEIKYDTTKIYTIKEVRDGGEYRVSDGSASFLAYSESEDYKVDDDVYVLIPNGDFDETKLITGKVKKRDKAEIPYNYVLPEKAIIPVEKFVVSGEFGLLANGDNYWQYNELDLYSMALGNTISASSSPVFPKEWSDTGYIILRYKLLPPEFDERYNDKTIFGEGHSALGGNFVGDNIIGNGTNQMYYPGEYVFVKKVENLRELRDNVGWLGPLFMYHYINYYYLDENGNKKYIDQESYGHSSLYFYKSETFLDSNGILHELYPRYDSSNQENFVYFSSINDLRFEIQSYCSAQVLDLFEKYQKVQLYYQLDDEEMQCVDNNIQLTIEKNVVSNNVVVGEFRINFKENEEKQKQLEKLQKQKQGQFTFYAVFSEPINLLEVQEEVVIKELPHFSLCQDFFTNSFIIPIEQNKTISGYDRLLLSSDFKTDFNTQVQSGDYGVILELQTKQIPFNKLSKDATNVLNAFNLYTKQLIILQEQLRQEAITLEDYGKKLKEIVLNQIFIAELKKLYYTNKTISAQEYVLELEKLVSNLRELNKLREKYEDISTSSYAIQELERLAENRVSINDLEDYFEDNKITFEKYVKLLEKIVLNNIHDSFSILGELKLGENNEVYYVYAIDLNSLDMIGNTYNFLDYSKQQEVFDIENIGPIERIEGKFYQNNNFTQKNQEGEEEPLSYEQDLYYLYKNLFAKNISLSFGYPSDTIIGDNYVQLYTRDELEYKAPEERTVYLRWIQKENNVWNIKDTINSDTEKVEWYKYDLYDEKQVDGWVKIEEANEQGFSLNIITDTTKTVTRLKARAHYKETEGAEKYIDSPSFEFIHTVPTVDQITLDATTRFTLGTYLGEEGGNAIYDFENNYYLYGLDNQIVDKSYIKQMPLILRDNVDNINYPLYYQPLEETDTNVFKFTTKSSNELNTSNIEGIIYKSLLNINENAMFAISYDANNQLYIQIKSTLEQKDNLLVGTLIKNQIQYSFSKEFEFGQLGNTGTKHTILMDLYQYEDNKKKQELLYYPLGSKEDGISVQLDIRVVNEENKKVDIDTQYISTSFELKNLTVNDNIISDGANSELGDILKVKIDKAAGLAEHDIIAYFPIPVTKDFSISGVTGATQVVYSSWGTPSYYQGKYELYKQGIKQECDWFVGKNTVDGYININTTGGTQDSFGPSIVDDELYPPSAYLDNFEQYYIQAKNSENVLLWSCPLLIIQNKYFSNTLNEWDGQLKINEADNHILAKMFAAGHKTENNTFSGVVMGDLEEGLFTKRGLLGFNDGVRTFELNSEDGSAFFGGEVDVDGRFLVSKEGITNINHLLIGGLSEGLQINSSSGVEINLKYRDYIENLINTYISEEVQSDFRIEFEKSISNDTDEFEDLWSISNSAIKYKSKNYGFKEEINEETKNQIWEDLSKIYRETFDDDGKKQTNKAHLNGKLYLEQIGHLMFDFQNSLYSFGYQGDQGGLGLLSENTTNPVFMGVKYGDDREFSADTFDSYEKYFDENLSDNYSSRLSPGAWAEYLRYKLDAKNKMAADNTKDYIELSIGDETGDKTALRVYNNKITCQVNYDNGTSSAEQAIVTLEDLKASNVAAVAETFQSFFDLIGSPEFGQLVENIIQGTMSAFGFIAEIVVALAPVLLKIVGGIMDAIGDASSEDIEPQQANTRMLKSVPMSINTGTIPNSADGADVLTSFIRLIAGATIAADLDLGIKLFDSNYQEVSSPNQTASYFTWEKMTSLLQRILPKSTTIKEYFNFIKYDMSDNSEYTTKALELKEKLQGEKFSLNGYSLSQLAFSHLGFSPDNNIFDRIKDNLSDTYNDIQADLADTYTNIQNNLKNIFSAFGDFDSITGNGIWDKLKNLVNTWVLDLEEFLNMDIDQNGVTGIQGAIHLLEDFINIQDNYSVQNNTITYTKTLTELLDVLTITQGNKVVWDKKLSTVLNTYATKAEIQEQYVPLSEYNEKIAILENKIAELETYHNDITEGEETTE